ncbi:cyclic nucleotide-binding domain-containing protein [Aquincola sp. MAHUQ-54]|uniref:Cyclic nucleotide-binding domain-containing protein n=1 Tax=Aquincola agrisoli TaxID=3119538 RepID=A0AAW9QBY4_9BURK
MNASSSTVAPPRAQQHPGSLALRPSDGARELIQILDADTASATAQVLWRLGIPRRRVKGLAALFNEGDSVESLYVVQVGTFKLLKTAEDGYEQVLGFCSRGDVLGGDGLWSHRHPTAAVALEDSSVFALPLNSLQRLTDELPTFDRALQGALSRQLAAAAEVAEVMAAVSAEVRLARFLVQRSSRMVELGESPRHLLLRMSRRDIASALGVAHETVSRSFGILAEWGYLRVDNRNIEILDLEGIRACSRSTRGLLEPRAHARS